MNLSASINIINLLKKHEGTGPIKNGNLMPYQDSVGLLTIGYGFCLDRSGLTEQEATLLLQHRTDKILDQCHTEFDWFKTLTDARQAVVISMVFNLGFNGFKNFKRTIAHIDARDYQGAGVEMLSSKWAEQVKVRAHELSRMMKTGEWQ